MTKVRDTTDGRRVTIRVPLGNGHEDCYFATERPDGQLELRGIDVIARHQSTVEFGQKNGFRSGRVQREITPDLIAKWMQVRDAVENDPRWSVAPWLDLTRLSDPYKSKMKVEGDFAFTLSIPASYEPISTPERSASVQPPQYSSQTPNISPAGS